MEITIDPFNIDKAIKEFEEYRTKVDKGITESVKQAVEIGKAEAQTRFTIAEYDGPRDVKVTSKVNKRSGRVTASGESVLFIEFGTGLEAENPRDIPEEFYTTAYLPGSWSEGPEGKGHWDDPGGWYYGHGRKTKGNKANKCMYDAYKEVERNIRKIVKEVFKCSQT